MMTQFQQGLGITTVASTGLPMPTPSITQQTTEPQFQPQTPLSIVSTNPTIAAQPQLPANPTIAVQPQLPINPATTTNPQQQQQQQQQLPQQLPQQQQQQPITTLPARSTTPPM
jgi:hypothetical protein